MLMKATRLKVLPSQYVISVIVKLRSVVIVKLRSVVIVKLRSVVEILLKI
jgi:hypothetical protein